jgi:hypothetical protein
VDFVALQSVSAPGGTNLPYLAPADWRRDAAVPTSADAGDVVSWSVDAYGHVFPDQRATADDELSHVVVDPDGVEWSVRALTTPQTWARAPRCLVLSSRDCVRRLWTYPSDWRELGADALFRLGRID